jgi:hypothetical protein
MLRVPRDCKLRIDDWSVATGMPQTASRLTFFFAAGIPAVRVPFPYAKPSTQSVWYLLDFGLAQAA